MNKHIFSIGDQVRVTRSRYPIMTAPEIKEGGCSSMVTRG